MANFHQEKKNIDINIELVPPCKFHTSYHVVINCYGFIVFQYVYFIFQKDLDQPSPLSSLVYFLCHIWMEYWLLFPSTFFDSSFWHEFSPFLIQRPSILIICHQFLVWFFLCGHAKFILFNLFSYLPKIKGYSILIFHNNCSWTQIDI